MLRELLRALVSQDRAVANARSASTRLSRSRVERDEVLIFLEAIPAPRSASPVRRSDEPDEGPVAAQS